MNGEYDRTVEDLGNSVLLEHVNVTIPDQQLATLFYVYGLGLTRDPFLMVSTDNLWVNVGRNQFHLPTRAPQVLRGHTGVIIPGREALLHRLTNARRFLKDTRFDFQEHEDYIAATCPWGNQLRCYEPSSGFGMSRLGIPYVELDIPAGSGPGIARFYRQYLGIPAAVVEDMEGRHVRVTIGIEQQLIMRETDRALPEYDGHHIAIYLADFSGPYQRLLEHGLVCEESDQHQYRLKDLIDPETGQVLFTMEHEVRSLRHPLFMRPLVNRNPDQRNTRYAPGYDATGWGMLVE